MKPPPFAYVSPPTLDQALSELAAEPASKLLAGGQSLMPLLNMRLTHPRRLVDLGAIATLRRQEVVGDRLVLGAMVTHHILATDPQLTSRLPILAQAGRHIGHRQIRHRGTLGGSLVHADPAAEWPTVMTTLEAAFRLEGIDHQRWVAAGEFFQGYLTTAIAPDEILTEVHIPLPAAPTAYGFAEIARRQGDFAIAMAACSLTAGADGRIQAARLTLGGIAGRPVRATVVEEGLIGHAIDDPALFENLTAIADLVEIDDDVQASRAYRRRVAPEMARDALRQAVDQLASALSHPNR